MSTNIFYIEKELGAYITDEYPLPKLLNQIEELQEHIKKENEASKKANRNTIGR